MNQLKYLVMATIRLLINTDKTRVYLALVPALPSRSTTRSFCSNNSDLQELIHDTARLSFMSSIVKVQSQKCLSLFPLNYELINVLIVPAGISNLYDEFHEEPSVYIIDVYRYNSVHRRTEDDVQIIHITNHTQRSVFWKVKSFQRLDKRKRTKVNIYKIEDT